MTEFVDDAEPMVVQHDEYLRTFHSLDAGAIGLAERLGVEIPERADDPEAVAQNETETDETDDAAEVTDEPVPDEAEVAFEDDSLFVSWWSRFH